MTTRFSRPKTYVAHRLIHMIVAWPSPLISSVQPMNTSRHTSVSTVLRCTPKTMPSSDSSA